MLTGTDRPHRIAVTQECSGSHHHSLANRNPGGNLGLGIVGQTNGNAPLLDVAVVDDENAVAAAPLSDGGGRNGYRGAAGEDNRRTGEGADVSLGGQSDTNL